MENFIQYTLNMLPDRLLLHPTFNFPILINLEILNKFLNYHNLVPGVAFIIFSLILLIITILFMSPNKENSSEEPKDSIDSSSVIIIHEPIERDDNFEAGQIDPVIKEEPIEREEPIIPEEIEQEITDLEITDLEQRTENKNFLQKKHYISTKTRK